MIYLSLSLKLVITQNHNGSQSLLTAKQGKIKSEQGDKSISENKKIGKMQQMWCPCIFDPTMRKMIASTVLGVWQNRVVSECTSTSVVSYLFFPLAGSFKIQKPNYTNWSCRLQPPFYFSESIALMIKKEISLANQKLKRGTHLLYEQLNYKQHRSFQ